MESRERMEKLSDSESERDMERYYELLRRKFEKQEDLDSDEETDLNGYLNDETLLEPKASIDLPAEKLYNEMLSFVCKYDLVVDDKICKILSKVILDKETVRLDRIQAINALLIEKNDLSNRTNYPALYAYLRYAFEQEFGEEFDVLFLKSMKNIINFSAPESTEECNIRLISEDEEMFSNLIEKDDETTNKVLKTYGIKVDDEIMLVKNDGRFIIFYRSKIDAKINKFQCSETLQELLSSLAFNGKILRKNDKKGDKIYKQVYEEVKLKKGYIRVMPPKQWLFKKLREDYLTEESPVKKLEAIRTLSEINDPEKRDIRLFLTIFTDSASRTHRTFISRLRAEQVSEDNVSYALVTGLKKYSEKRPDIFKEKKGELLKRFSDKMKIKLKKYLTDTDDILKTFFDKEIEQRMEAKERSEKRLQKGKSVLSRLFLELMDAIKADDTDLIDELCSKNPNLINCFDDENGFTPLMIACASNKEEAVKSLLENGADCEAVNNDGNTPLHLAVGLDDAEIGIILNLLFYPEDIKDKKITTEMFENLKNENMSYIVELRSLFQQNTLTRRSDIRKKNKKGETAWELAIESGNLSYVKLFLAVNAQINSTAYQHVGGLPYTKILLDFYNISDANRGLELGREYFALDFIDFLFSLDADFSDEENDSYIFVAFSIEANIFTSEYVAEKIKSSSNQERDKQHKQLRQILKKIDANDSPKIFDFLEKVKKELKKLNTHVTSFPPAQCEEFSTELGIRARKNVHRQAVYVNTTSLQQVPVLRNLLISDELENAMNLPSQMEIQVYAKKRGIPLTMPKAAITPDHASKSPQKQLEKKLENEGMPEVGLDKSKKTGDFGSPAPLVMHYKQKITNAKRTSINIVYQYEDNDIQAILSARLKQFWVQNFPFTKPVEVLAAVDNIMGMQLESRLTQELRIHQSARICLIPCNLGNAHWVGILLEFNAAGQVSRAEYIDSLKSKTIIPETFKKQLQQVYPNAHFKIRELLRQDDYSSCGAYTIENLLVAALGIPSPKPDTIRGLHLEALEQNNSVFYAAFNERQRNNRPTTADLHEQLGYLDRLKNIWFSKQELNRILTIKKCLYSLPENIQTALLKAFEYKPLDDDHASHLNVIRAALKEAAQFDSKAIEELIGLLFETRSQSSASVSLDKLKFRVSYNEILAITQRHLVPEQISSLQQTLAEQTRQDEELALKLQAELWNVVEPSKALLTAGVL